jgi:putative restriction endonuclease
MHHAAYDKNLLGIAPDRIVHINRELLDEIDGPMLRHGLQDMHGREISVPRAKVERPDPARLEARFEHFLSA